jgi:hypothetical protein
MAGDSVNLGGNMVSRTEATASNLAAQLKLLQRQAAAAFRQQQAAEKTMSSFAEYLKQNPSGDNTKEYQELVSEAHEANNASAALRKKVNEAEIAFLKQNPPSQEGGSLEDKGVVVLNIDEPVGYFPTQNC